MRTTIIRIQLNNNPIRKNIKNLPITPLTRRGTGKTYASAFAMRELGFKRVLFLVHRSTLAKQALTSFRKVFEDKKSMGIVGAGYSDYEADYIFAMVETLHKADNLRKFDPEEFDCIVLDDERVIIRTKLEKPSKIKGLALI